MATPTRECVRGSEERVKRVKRGLDSNLEMNMRMALPISHSIPPVTSILIQIPLIALKRDAGKSRLRKREKRGSNIAEKEQQ